MSTSLLSTSKDGADAGTEVVGSSIGGEQKRLDLLHDAERLITFTDAVVAIAMTLLIVPLMEAAADMGNESSEVQEGEKSAAAQYFAEHGSNLASLAISFSAINIAWGSHDMLFRYVARFNTWLVRLNHVWMGGIVFFPVAAALLTATSDDRAANAAYMGTGLVIAVAKLAMTFLVRRDGRTLKYEDRPPGLLLVGDDVITVVIFALALLVSLVVPSTGLYILLLLLAKGPTSHLMKWLKPDWTY